MLTHTYTHTHAHFLQASKMIAVTAQNRAKGTKGNEKKGNLLENVAVSLLKILLHTLQIEISAGIILSTCCPFN